MAPTVSKFSSFQAEQHPACLSDFALCRSLMCCAAETIFDRAAWRCSNFYNQARWGICMTESGETLVFKVRHHVLLVNPALRDWIGIGAVVNVHPGDSDLYDVEFPSGRQTVHGRELMLASTFTHGCSCDEKKHLLAAHNKAFDIYIRGASALAEAVGLMAHAEFEFLSSRVRTARQSLVEARRHLIEHTAKHGC